MPTRRSARLSGGSETFSPFLTNLRAEKSSKTKSANDENRDGNRLSGVFQNQETSEARSKNKLAGSLFAAKTIDEPRRRSNFGSGDKSLAPLLPMRKTSSKQVVKTKSIPKKKPTLPTSESEFDNMADMFGTSPMTKTTAIKPAPKSVKQRTPTKPKVPKPEMASLVENKAASKSPFKPKAAKSPVKQYNKRPEPQSEQEIDIDDNEEYEMETADIEYNEELATQFVDLQKRFEQLNMLRTTSAEQLFADYKKAAEARDQSAQVLIESLRNENSLLKERLESQNKSRRDSNISMISVTTTGSSTAAANSMLELYSNLTGLEMSPLEENKWTCTIQGRHGSYSFQLEFDSEAEEYTYTPVQTHESTVWDRLPGYLKEEIVFGEGYLQSFFWRALNFLMS